MKGGKGEVEVMFVLGCAAVGGLERYCTVLIYRRKEKEGSDVCIIVVPMCYFHVVFMLFTRDEAGKKKREKGLCKIDTKRQDSTHGLYNSS